MEVAPAENFGEAGSGSASDKERAEYENLLRKNNDGVISPQEKARLGELELKLKKNAQGAAMHLYDACLMAPRNKAIRKRYQTAFKKEDLLHWGLGRAPVPVWADIINILKYPVENGNWLGLLLAGIFISIMHYLQMIGFFGLIINIILVAFIGSHVCLHIRWAANGKLGEPPPVELDFSNLWYMFMGYIAAFLPAVVLMLIAGTSGSNAMGIVALIILLGGIFILPMCFLVARLFNSVWQGFNYPFVMQSILKVFGEYFFAVILIYAIFAFYSIAMPVLVVTVPPLRYVFFLFDLANLYVLTVAARILGLLYFNNQKKLGWFK